MTPPGPSPYSQIDPLNLGKLDPVQQGSGLKQERKGELDNLSRSTDTRALMIDPEQWQQAYSQAEQMPAFQEQKAGIDQLQNLLAARAARPTSVDLSPLLALTDTWTGSNLQKGYQRPQNDDEQFKTILDYAQKVQQDKRDLSKNIVDAVAKQKGGQSTEFSQTLQKLNESMAAEDLKSKMRQVPEDSKLHWLQTSVDKDMKDLKTSNAALQEGERLLSSGASVSDTSFRDQFLKAMIGGRVTNYDLMRQSGDTSLASKAEQAWETLTTGKFSDRNRGEYQQALRTIGEANAHEAALRLARAKRIGLETYGLHEEQVDPIVSGFGIGPSHTAPKAKPRATQPKVSAPASSGLPSQSDIQAEIDRRKKARGQ